MSKWLSPEWFDQTLAVAADQSLPSGLSARIHHELSGGPDGEVRYFWLLEDGHLTDGGVGTVGQPDVTLTLGWNDAADILRGELDASVAFMQGRMKVGGSMGVMIRLLPAAATLDLRRRVAAVTEF